MSGNRSRGAALALSACALLCIPLLVRHQPQEPARRRGVQPECSDVPAVASASLLQRLEQGAFDELERELDAYREAKVRAWLLDGVVPES